MKTIIVVADDDFFCRELMSILLKDVRVPVYFSENGGEALKIIESKMHQCDEILLFTDLKMPVLDGYQLISKLKHVTCVIKIVVTSSYAFYEVRSLFERPIDGYIQKPILKDQIKKFIEKYTANPIL